jgi:tetratricopeptide (TPR) repeat protein
MFFFVLAKTPLRAQHTDSLLQVLKTAKSDTNKVLLLNEIASTYFYSEPSAGKIYAQKALNLAKQLHFVAGQAKSYYYLGNFELLAGNLKAAKLHYLKALSFFKKTGNLKAQGPVFGQLGAICLLEEKFDQALDYRLRALRIYERSNDTVNIGATYSSIANIYTRTGAFEEAEKYFDQALVYKKAIGDRRGESIIYMNLGLMNYERRQYDAALANSRQALAIQEELGDARIIVGCKFNMANVYYQQNHFAEAMARYRECYTLYEEQKDSISLTRVLIGIANVEMSTHHCQEALNYFNQVLEIADKLQDPELLRSIYLGFCSAYICLGDSEKSSEYLEKVDQMNKATFSKQLSENMARQKIKYEAEKKERDILLLGEKNKAANALAEKRRVWIIAILALVVLVMSVLFLLVALDRSRKKQKQLEFVKMKAELEQTALRAQMNPHFIFNALNSIQHYILNKETEYAYDYLAKFSKLIRQILINSEENQITLEKEIGMLSLYLELEQRRFKKRFDFRINYPDDLPLDDIAIPTMLIQPFVENAIWHGIMNLDKTVTGKLEIGFSLSGNSLTITVKDNGVGRKAAALKKVNNEYKSVGVLFTQKRLELLKTITHQHTHIAIHDLFDENGHAKGTKVELIIELNDGNHSTDRRR